MYKHILVATDGSKLSAKAVKSGIALARTLKARVTVFHAYPEFRLLDEGYVMPDARDVREYFKRETHAQAQKIISAAEKTAKAANVAFEGVARETDLIHEEIIATAKRKKCDLIVMASHGRKGLSGLLIGSETAKVLAHSVIPVLVVR